MDNKKLRKCDRVLNVIKAGAKRTHKGFQKIQPVTGWASYLLPQQFHQLKENKGQELQQPESFF